MTFNGKPPQNNHTYWDGTKFVVNPEPNYRGGNVQTAGDGFLDVNVPFYTINGRRQEAIILSSSNTSPIVITTTVRHGYKTGDVIQIAGHSQTAANGIFTLTYLTNTTFSLNGSTTSGSGGNNGTITKDDTAEINAFISSHASIGGTIRVSHGTILNKVDFSPTLGGGNSIILEIEGVLWQLTNGAELELYPLNKIKGVGGGGNVSGDFTVHAGITQLNFQGNEAFDPRLAGTDGYLTGPYYVANFQGYPSNVANGFPTGTINDSLIGQTLVISGGDSTVNGNWTIMGSSLNSSLNIGAANGTGCRAVWTGAGKPNSQQHGLSWSIPSISASGGTLGITYVIQTSRFSHSNANIALLNTTIWKDFVYISNSSQTWLNGTFKAVGTDSLTGQYFYIANNTAFNNNGYTTPATLPDYGTGGTPSVPTLHFQIVMPAIRCEGTTVHIEDITIIAALGVCLDGAKNLTANCFLENVSIEAYQNPASTPLILDQAFENYFRNCAFFPYIFGNNQYNGWCVLITGSGSNFGQGSTYDYFDFCKFVTSGLLIQVQDGLQVAQGPFSLRNCLTENGSIAPVVLDPRSGSTNEILIDYMSINDPAVQPIYLIDELVPGHIGDFSIIRVHSGAIGNGFPYTGPNFVGVGQTGMFEIRQQDPFANGFDIGNAQDFILERGNRLDAVITGSPASFSPTINVGFNMTLLPPTSWSTGAGTAVISFPSGVVGPDGIANSSTVSAVPVISSSSSIDTKTILDQTINLNIGDYFIIGGWVQTLDPITNLPIKSLSKTNITVLFNGRVITLNNTPTITRVPLNDNNTVKSTSEWRYIESIAKITDGYGSTEVRVNVGVADNTVHLAVRNLWVKYIPATTSISELEIIRWYRQGQRHNIPGTGAGNLGIDPLHRLDWGGNVNIGNDGYVGHLVTNATSFTLNNSSSILAGNGSPNGFTNGNVGDIYINSISQSGPNVYIKNSGSSTNTNWNILNPTPVFDPTTLGGCKLWMRGSSSIIQTSNRVSLLKDQSGNGFDFIQNTGANQPLYVASDINGMAAFQFDSTARFMTSNNTNTISAQPFTIWLVMKQNSWSSAKRILDTNSGARFVVNQFTSTPQLSVFAGTAFIGNNGNLAVGNYGIVQIQVNGSSSFVQVNEGTQLTGNPGTNAWGAPGDIPLIGSSTLGSANVNIAEIIVFNRALSTTDQHTVRNGLRNTYGLLSYIDTDITFTDVVNRTIGIKGLTANRTINLPGTPSANQIITIKDVDGSLASFNVVLNGNGNNINGSSTYTLTTINTGPFATVSVFFMGTSDGWIII